MVVAAHISDESNYGSDAEAKDLAERWAATLVSTSKSRGAA